jgi:two-component system cell cycle sensor histidine kinase/response regulator CckA
VVGALGERVKELTLLHQVARLLESRAPLDRLFADLVRLLPDACQHPSLCEARVSCEGIVAQTAGFVESAWMLRAPLGAAEGQGAIDVAYRQAPAGSGPAFLAEEVELLESVATLVAAHLGRRHLEAASLQSEQRLRAVIEHTPNVFIQWYDAQSRLLHCNRATEQLLGITIESARGRTLEQLNFSQAEAERFRTALQTVSSMGQAVGPTEFQFRRPDGTPGVMLSTIFELPANGGERCFACMDVDLTEHRRMERAARAEGRLRELIYCSVVDILFCVAVEPDNVYRFVAVNPAFSIAARRKEEEIIGRRLEEVVPAALLPMTLARYAEAMAERRPVSWEQTCEADAWPRHAEVTLTPVFDAAGHCENLVGTVRDITARKRADEERRSLEQQLHHAQRLQALGTLAGGIAHDFNNVLAAIAGNTELGLLELDSSHAAHECLTEIEKATRRASDLVRQILAFSRHDVPSRSRLDAREVVAEVTRLLRATFPAHIRFELDLAEDTPPICADGSQLHQVLMNLGTNAALAIGARAGTVRFTARRHRATAAGMDGPPELAPGECYAELAVIDDGCGMDRATLGRMFEPFFTTRPQGRGTGLGLSVVHGIVHRHDGALTVDSVRGQGTTFRLFFPASEAVPSAVARVDGVAAVGRGSHILFVDDEQALVFVAERLLPQRGYRVTAYTDSIRALAEFRARASEFDVVVTDFSMPGLSGPAFVQEVRRVRSDIPVVMTSGYIGPEELEAARAVGVEEIVLKPRTMNELVRVVHERLAALAHAAAVLPQGVSRDLSSTPKSHCRTAFEA